MQTFLRLESNKFTTVCIFPQNTTSGPPQDTRHLPVFLSVLPQEYITSISIFKGQSTSSVFTVFLLVFPSHPFFRCSETVTNNISLKVIKTSKKITTQCSSWHLQRNLFLFHDRHSLTRLCLSTYPLKPRLYFLRSFSRCKSLSHCNTPEAMLFITRAANLLTTACRVPSSPHWVPSPRHTLANIFIYILFSL